MRYRLRTLMILLAVLPPLLAGAWLGVRAVFKRTQQRGPYVEKKTYNCDGTVTLKTVWPDGTTTWERFRRPETLPIPP